MKVNIEKIRNINTVFLFVFCLLAAVCILGLSGYAVWELIADINGRAGRSVYVIEDEEKESAVYSTEFIAACKDVYVFAKKGTKLAAVKQGFDTSANLMEAKYSAYSDPEEIVNLYFISEKNKQKRRLFESDALILSYAFVHNAGDEKNPHFFAASENVYIAAPVDTDGDGKLTSKDDTPLYVSEYDGSGLKKISDNVFTCRFIADNTLLFCEYTDKQCVYTRYDMNAGTTDVVFSAQSVQPEKDVYGLQTFFR